MEQEEFKVYELTGCEETTGKMWDNANLPQNRRALAVEVSEGNPGCMVYLTHLYPKISDSDFSLLCACFKVKKLKGSTLYSFIKKQGSVDNAILEFKKVHWL